MKLLKIFRNGVLVDRKELPEAEALAYIEANAVAGNYGRYGIESSEEYEVEPARVEEYQAEVSPAVLDEQGNELVPAQYETRTRDIPAVIGTRELFSPLEEIFTHTLQDLAHLSAEQKIINEEALRFLEESDWKRNRHISQKSLGIATSLSESEYLAMEQECQDARNRIVR